MTAGAAAADVGLPIVEVSAGAVKETVAAVCSPASHATAAGDTAAVEAAAGGFASLGCEG